MNRYVKKLRNFPMEKISYTLLNLTFCHIFWVQSQFYLKKISCFKRKISPLTLEYDGIIIRRTFDRYTKRNKKSLDSWTTFCIHTYELLYIYIYINKISSNAFHLQYVPSINYSCSQISFRTLCCISLHSLINTSRN
jgi:hypothetical protein